MKVYVEKENRSLTMKGVKTVSELLKRLAVNPQAVIVVKNKEVVLEDETLGDKDTVDILSVVSGG